MAGIERDWIERLTKALLPRVSRVWIRRRRHRRFFQQHVRPTDVFLVGHPKSGNTWLAYMLAVLRAHDRSHEVTLANLREYVPFVHGKDIRIADYPALHSPRVFREEYPVHHDLYPKTIYLIRDPRSVIVSLYHMYRIECDDASKPIAEFVEDYLNGTGCFRTWNRGLIRWDRQVEAWMKRAEQPDRVMVVRYENMVHNRRGVLEKTAEFAGLVATHRNLDEAAALGDFCTMQELEARHGTEAYPGEMSNRGRFIRAGKTNGWEMEIDGALVRRIEEELGPAMRTARYLLHQQ